VNRLKPFVALIVLALWASCTIRCELWCLAGSEEAACCVSAEAPSPAMPAPADDCVCSWVKSGRYIAETSLVPLPLPVGVLLKNLSADLSIPSSPASIAVSTTSPPDLLPSWQFSSRAALPPRAPSFVS